MLSAQQAAIVVLPVLEPHFGHAIPHLTRALGREGFFFLCRWRQSRHRHKNSSSTPPWAAKDLPSFALLMAR